ncbi:MAG: YbaK/EbsC family protein [Bacilli bacterium]|nr:YbaK/EbsC family protein [Bacilli bacterium]
MVENENNKKCMQIIKKLNLNPRIVTHEPILNYETAAKVDEELGLTGTETKTLFLKSKTDNYYLFITLATERMDSKLLKNILGEKINMVSKEEMTELTNMQPGCMTPFGLNEGLIKSIVVDPKIYNEEKLILAFGSETMSMEITPNDLKTILEDTYKIIIPLN